MITVSEIRNRYALDLDICPAARPYLNGRQATEDEPLLAYDVVWFVNDGRVRAVRCGEEYVDATGRFTGRWFFKPAVLTAYEI